ncbi:MAG: ATP-binding protein [Marinifilaceae bacterium]
MTIKSEIFEIQESRPSSVEDVINIFEEGILVFNHEFCVESANKKAMRQFGYSRKNLIGKSCLELFHLKGGICPVCQIPKTSNFPSLEVKIKRPFSRKMLRVQSTSILDDNGQVKKIVQRIFDEPKILSNKTPQRLNLLIDHKIYEDLPMSFQILDGEGRFMNVNPMWLKNFGFLKEEVVGEEFIDFLAPESREVFEKKIKKNRPGGLFSGLELKVRKRRGRYLHVLMDGCFQFDEKGKVKQILCFLKEIQGQVSYAKLLEREMRKIESESQKKSAFLANMSHEIRNPMNGILGFTDLLRQGNLTSEQKSRYLDLIHNNGEVLLNLINDIMNLSRLDAGQVVLHHKRFSLTELMNFLLEHFRVEKEMTGNSRVELIWDTNDEEREVFISSDRYRLQQVLTNLIGNAIKFTRQGEVRFGFRLEEKQILFFVKDTGIGIAPQYQKDVFDRYKQVPGEAIGNKNGNGLGLAICKAIVDLFEGQIWVESQLGRGSEFYFTIPDSTILDREEGVDEISQPSAKNYDWSSHTILVAEDEIMNYLFLEELLAPTKVKLLHAENGQQALDLIQETESVDLVLMDIKMPVLNGYEATRKIKRINKNLPVIAQTAYSMDEDYQKCKNVGCDDYISKPIAIPLLLSMIEKYF